MTSPGPQSSSYLTFAEGNVKPEQGRHLSLSTVGGKHSPDKVAEVAEGSRKPKDRRDSRKADKGYLRLTGVSLQHGDTL